MRDIENGTSNQRSSSTMKYAMWACCAVMLLPVGIYFAAGGLSAGLGSSLFTFAPLVLCIGAHLVMHRFMGKSCHGEGMTKDSVVNDTPQQPARTNVAET